MITTWQQILPAHDPGTGRTLNTLKKLGGRQIALVDFYENLTWMRGDVAAYLLTRYLLPFATFCERTVGIHLLPTYVSARKFAIAELDPESDRLIDCAHSLEAYIYRKLLEFEAEGEDLDRELAAARAIFGTAFYRPGQHGRFAADELERVMIERFGGAAIDYKDLAERGGRGHSIEEQIACLERGVAAAPDCMYLHVKLTQLQIQREDHEAAARSYVRSLRCYHHTAYGTDMASYYALGRHLAERVPAAFPALAQQELQLQSGEARLAWIVSLFERGHLETSLKLLSDFRYDSRTDLHPLLLRLLRRHYEQLGWEWALNWVEVCSTDGGTEETYDYLDQPLAKGWDQAVREIVASDR